MNARKDGVLIWIERKEEKCKTDSSIRNARLFSLFLTKHQQALRRSHSEAVTKGGV